MADETDTFSFESNKINAPPNSRNKHVSSYTEPVLFGDGSRSTVPNTKFSLKILSPTKTKSNTPKHSQSSQFGHELTVNTPKTRGLKLIRKTSSNYTNEEFTKRLSIPSFHVADQILMDLLNEQNNTAMNTIDEEETDDNDMDIVQFMQDDLDEDMSDQFDSQSTYTLDAFPDLPDMIIPNRSSELSPNISENSPNLSQSYSDDNGSGDDLSPNAFKQMFSKFHKTESKTDIGIIDKSERKSDSKLGFSQLQRSKTQKLLSSNSGQNKVLLVAKELFETEMLYQNHLINLQYLLLGPIASTYFGNDCVSSVFYKFLCNIISVSKAFTMRLSIYVRAGQIPQLANWIYFTCKRFNVYAHYAKMYDIFLDRLALCKSIDANIGYWIKAQERKCKAQLHNQKMSSLLMMPVQRLPRYILLLEELIKHICSSDTDVGTILFLELAKSEIQTVSQRVNEMVRQRENRTNLRELINRFCGENKNKLLRSNRVLVYEGFLYKVRKYKIKYYFHLFSDVLVYSNIDHNGLFNIHRIISLNKIQIINLPNIDENITKQQSNKGRHKIWYRFLLKSKEKSFELLTENEQEKINWLLLIEAAISRINEQPITPKMNGVMTPSNSTLPDSDGEDICTDIELSKSQMSVTVAPNDIDDDDYYAPYWVPDDASDNCSCCDKQFTVLNRRHHCRRCGKLVCKACSKNKKLLPNIQKKKAVKICNNCFVSVNNTNNALQTQTVLTPVIDRQNSNNKSRDILKLIVHYQSSLQSILTHLVRPLSDVVENNKIITQFIKEKRFYNKSNIKMNKMSKKGKKKKCVQKAKLRKKAHKTGKRKSKALNATDISASAILHKLYKFRSGYKSLLTLLNIIEQIYDICNLLITDLKLIIFKKHVNYEDDWLLDFYDDLITQNINDADHARIGRLMIMYTDLFNLHIDYASRFHECYALFFNCNAKAGADTNYLRDFMHNVETNLKGLKLRDLMRTPLQFISKIYKLLSQIERNVDNVMTNKADLTKITRILGQINRELAKEAQQSQQRIRLSKLESEFDYKIDFRQRGRTLIISDFVILKKNGAHKSGNNYYFHLFNDILCYSNKKIANNKFVFKAFISLSNVSVFDGDTLSKAKQSNSKKSQKKKHKKVKNKTISMQFYANYHAFMFNYNANVSHKKQNKLNIIIDEDNESDHECADKKAHKSEEMKSEEMASKLESVLLIFDSKEKKQTWLELLQNLIEEQKLKYFINGQLPTLNVKSAKNQNHLRSYSASSMKRYSATVGKQYEFCGICHSTFNPLFNAMYTCIKCDLPLCDACCIGKFYLNKTVIAPKHLKLCIRCNYYNHNERTCNILCV